LALAKEKNIQEGVPHQGGIPGGLRFTTPTNNVLPGEARHGVKKKKKKNGWGLKRETETSWNNPPRLGQGGKRIHLGWEGKKGKKGAQLSLDRARCDG